MIPIFVFSSISSPPDIGFRGFLTLVQVILAESTILINGLTVPPSGTLAAAAL